MEDLKVPSIEISSELKLVAPNINLGVICAEVDIVKKIEGLWQELLSLGDSTARSFTDAAALYQSEPIRAARAAFKACGKDPSRYAVSSEALLIRVLQKKPLYQINNVVEINNLISIRSLHSVGCYDLANITGPIIFKIGGAGDSYKAIGKKEVNLDGLPIFFDAKGPFGSPFSDSERAMIQLSTKKIMMVVISFMKDTKLIEYCKLASDQLIKYAGARKISTLIVK